MFRHGSWALLGVLAFDVQAAAIAPPSPFDVLRASTV
jgi:hypothetical protein